VHAYCARFQSTAVADVSCVFTTKITEEKQQAAQQQAQKKAKKAAKKEKEPRAERSGGSAASSHKEDSSSSVGRVALVGLLAASLVAFSFYSVSSALK